MKKNGAQAGILNGMVRGQTAFDAAAAKAALATIAEDMAAFPTLFPEGSDTGDTKAGPAIWSDRAGFEAAAAALQASAASAAESVTTLEQLQAVFTEIGASCGSCHQKYRS
jgi:cytochrome c556